MLAQSTDGTGCSISRVPDAGRCVGKGREDNDRVQDRDWMSYSSYKHIHVNIKTRLEMGSQLAGNVHREVYQN